MRKRLALALGLVLLAFLALLVAVSLLFDPNDYRDEIAGLVHEATGRELRILDDMELTLFPWLGVEVGEVVLANAAGYGPEPFARISGARVRLKLLPLLLHRRIELDTLTLRGLSLSLEVAADGRTNWDDLTAPPPGPRAPSGPGAPEAPGMALPAALAVNGLELRDASVHWHDAAASTELEISRLELTSGRIEARRPVSLDLAFDFNGRTPTAVNGHARLSTRITPDPERARYDFDGFDLRATLAGSGLPAAPLTLSLRGAAGVDLEQDSITVRGLSLSGAGIEARGELRATEVFRPGQAAPRVTGQMETAEFDPREVLTRLGIPPPETADPQALRRAGARLGFEASAGHLDIPQLEVRLDDTTVNGNATLRDFTKPAIGFRLSVDRLDLDRYLPPSTDSRAAAAGIAASPAGAAGLPMAPLRTLELEGGLDIGSLKAGGLTIDRLQITAAAKDGLISLAPVSGELYGGRVHGELRLDARGKDPVITLAETFSGIAIGALLADLTGSATVTGTGDVSIEARSRGTSPDALLRDLNGTVRLAFREGAVKGLNIAQMIREAKARLEGAPPPAAGTAQETDFTELHASVTVAGGIARNDDLRARSPYLRLTGSGEADLPARRLDYRLKVRIVDTPAGQGGADLTDLKGVEIPLRIAGDLTSPSIKLDSAAIRGILRDKARARLRKETEARQRELDERLQKKEEELKQRIEDKLKDGLRGLFR